MYKNIYRIEDINDVKKLDSPHMVKWVYINYKKLLRKVINDATYSFERIPLINEDFMNSFLINIPRLLEKFDDQMGVPFKKYICQECKYFVKNKCRKLLSRKFQVLNNYIDFQYADWLNNKNNQRKIISEIIIPFQPENLNRVETKIVNDLMELETTYRKYMMSRGFSRHNSQRILNSLRIKLSKQIES